MGVCLNLIKYMCGVLANVEGVGGVGGMYGKMLDWLVDTFCYGIVYSRLSRIVSFTV